MCQCLAQHVEALRDSLAFLGARGKCGEWPFPPTSCYSQHQELPEILDIWYRNFSESGYQVKYVRRPHRLELFANETFSFLFVVMGFA